MKKLSLRLLAAVGLMICGAAASRAEDAKPAADAGFKSMFNGKDLSGWDGLEGFWSVKDGVISGAETKAHPAPQTFLVYKDKFSDFELRFKFKFASKDGNSGVQFRSKVLDEKQRRIGGYQADFDAGQGYDGSIYDEGGVAGGRGTMSGRGQATTWDSDNKRHDKPLAETNDALRALIKKGDWNEAVVIAKGPHVTYQINGHMMTDLTDNSPKAVKEGVIGLQLHAGFEMDVQFKDLEIKDLSEAK